MAQEGHATRPNVPSLSPRWGGKAGDDAGSGPLGRWPGAFWEVFADIPRPESPVLPPVGVPVGPVWALGALPTPTPDALLAIGHLGLRLRIPCGTFPRRERAA